MATSDSTDTIFDDISSIEVLLLTIAELAAQALDVEGDRDRQPALLWSIEKMASAGARDIRRFPSAKLENAVKYGPREAEHA